MTKLSGTTETLNHIYFSDANDGTTVGTNGTILRTTNGGLSWQAQSSGRSENLVGVSFTNSTQGTVVGYNGTILKTTNSGITWSLQTSGIKNNLYNVFFTDVNTGIVVGNNGAIFRTTNGGFTFIGNKNQTTVPYGFSLSQNFPNPFNPNTVISYSLPSASNVKLILYNTLGQAVKVLETGFKQAGHYSVNFNASDLPTGIYFYKLESGQVSQVKKMILLK